MALTIPPRLKKGDTIGLISPSAGLAPFAMHRIEKAKKSLEEMGYQVKIGQNALKNNGYVSAPAKLRAKDFNDMFENKNISLIMCTIGGDHANQILKYLDFNQIRKNPKAFIGYSDTTVLHYALFTQANLATYYGPAAMTQFGENPTVFEYTREHFNKALTDHRSGVINFVPSLVWTEESLDWFQKKDLERPRKMKRNPGYRWLRGGISEGEIIGGAIPSINHLAGTKYWINPKAKILFIDIPEGSNFNESLPISNIDSFFADLDNLGVFKDIKGLVVGRPFNMKPEDQAKFENIVSEYSKEGDYPILLGVDLGHTDPMITIRYGAKVKLDSRKNLFRMHF